MMQMEEKLRNTCGHEALPQRGSREGAVSWFAMRVTYRREMKVKAEMDALGVQAFVPMQRIVQKGRRLSNALEPAIHNLIFIRASEEDVQLLKASRPELQYMVRKMDGKTEKIVVPDRQMADFMKVCTESPGFVEILPQAGKIQLRPGQEVMVVSGPLQGVRGYFLHVDGHRARRLVISIPGVCAATLQVEADEVTSIP